MKNIWLVIISVFQILVGLAAVASFIILEVNGESMGKWIPALIAAVAVDIGGILNLTGARKR